MNLYLRCFQIKEKRVSNPIHTYDTHIQKTFPFRAIFAAILVPSAAAQTEMTHQSWLDARVARAVSENSQ